MSDRTGTQVLESIERLAEQALLRHSNGYEGQASHKRESDDTKELYKALAAAQRSFFDLQKTGIITGRNTRYSKLSDLVDASRKALLEQSLVCNTYMRASFLVTRLVHFPTGQYIESELPLLNNTDEQKRGSSITYAWRYCYAPLIGLVDSSYDDDGTEASRKK